MIRSRVSDPTAAETARQDATVVEHLDGYLWLFKFAAHCASARTLDLLLICRLAQTFFDLAFAARVRRTLAFLHA